MGINGFVHASNVEPIKADTIDVARDLSNRRNCLPMWATDIPNPDNDSSMIGIKFFHVASYSAWAEYYRGLSPPQRCSYEIARVRPTRFYLDLDLMIAENKDITKEVFAERKNQLLRATRIEIARAAGVPEEDALTGPLGEVVILVSTRPAKISEHLVFPNAVLRNPFHCGALMRRIRDRLSREHEKAVGVGDKDNDHPFYIWSRIKDIAQPKTGTTVLERIFFADPKVYTFDRNFRIYGSRKNSPGALPLYEEGNVTGVFNWDVYHKSLLQRIPEGARIIDCPELDGSMPVSTSNAHFLRYDHPVAEKQSTLTFAPTATATAAAAGHGAAHHLTTFWESEFPFDILWYLASSRDAACERKFQCSDVNGKWFRPVTPSSVAELKRVVLSDIPASIHVCTVAGPGSDAPFNPTLSFDIDIKDYSSYRPCCGDSGSACTRCWPIAQFAQRALSSFLSEYGIEMPVFFFSGSKGVHAWVPPTCPRARKVAMSARARCTLMDDFTSVLGKPDASCGKDYAIPDVGANVHVRAHVLATLGGDSDEYRQVLRTFLCTEMGLRAQVERHERRHGLDSALVHVLWPRLDEAITRRIDHAIKAPFSVHARTSRVATWLPTPDANPYSAAAVDHMRNAQELRIHLGI